MAGIGAFINKMERLEKVVLTFPNKAAIQAVAFSKDRFVKQNWVDARTEPWKPRKGRGRDRGRGILIGKGRGRLKKSVRKIRVGRNFAVIGSDVPYAAVHNEGLRAGRGKGFKMPKRRFMGNSAVLAKQIERQLASEMIKALK